MSCNVVDIPNDLACLATSLRVLHSGLFHLVRDQPGLLQKVILLRGDLLSPKDLGIAQTQAEAEAEAVKSVAGPARHDTKTAVENYVSVTMRKPQSGPELSPCGSEAPWAAQGGGELYGSMEVCQGAAGLPRLCKQLWDVS